MALDFFGRVVSDRAAAVGLFVIALWIAVGMTVPLWAWYDPLSLVGRRLQPPGSAHWLGTDALGRDVFFRTLYGVRYSLPVSVAVIAVSVVIGGLAGLVAGYFGGWINEVVMRLVDLLAAFPPLILAMCVVTVFGGGILYSAFALIIVWWPIYARLVRAEVLAVKELDHVMAARLSTRTDAAIIRRHVAPLCIGPLVTAGTVDLGAVVMMVAGLSFIGLGAKPPTPEWGLMIFEGASMYQSWWITLGPGLGIVSLALAFNFVGDAVQAALDPRRGRQQGAA
jgi:peptide/nickel transport system permease protein